MRHEKSISECHSERNDVVGGIERLIAEVSVKVLKLEIAKAHRVSNF